MEIIIYHKPIQSGHNSRKIMILRALKQMGVHYYRDYYSYPITHTSYVKHEDVRKYFVINLTDEVRNQLKRAFQSGITHANHCI